MTIRHPHEQDHPRVLAVLDHWWGEFGGEAGSLQRALLLPRLYFQHFTTTSYLVEDARGGLSAFLVGFLSQTNQTVAYIHFVGVDPAFQMQGIGTALYSRFFEQTRQLGRRYIHCLTSPGNTGSQAFHTRMGFKSMPGAAIGDVQVQPDYDGVGLDRVVFSLDLAI
jgi:ribosomal protein S18 acetylase RimI-like enzyme